MHKNIPTCEVDLFCWKITKILNYDHLPPILKGLPEKLKEWFNARMLASITIKDVEEQKERNNLILHTRALNLSDCYWIKCKDNEKWEDINLFDNNYKSLLVEIKTGNEVATVSPIDKINGWRDKGWCIYKNNRYLFKNSFDIRYGYSDNDREMIIKNILNDFDIPVCDYSYLGKYIINPTESNSLDKELITAKDFYIEKFSNEDCILEKFYSLVASEIQNKINDMIIIDYIVNQKDRHYRNFGLLRNPDTLEILDLYPIYDNGGCFYYEDEPNHYSRIIHTNDIETKNHLLKSKTLTEDKLLKSLYKNIKNKEVLNKCKDKLGGLFL